MRKQQTEKMHKGTTAIEKNIPSGLLSFKHNSSIVRSLEQPAAPTLRRCVISNTANARHPNCLHPNLGFALQIQWIMPQGACKYALNIRDFFLEVAKRPSLYLMISLLTPTSCNQIAVSKGVH